MTRDALLAAVHDIAEDAAYARGHMHGADNPIAMAREVAALVREQIAELMDREPSEAPTRSA